MAPANQTVWQKLFDKYGREIVQSKLLMVEGKLQVADGVSHFVVQQPFNLTALPETLNVNTLLPQSRGETTKPVNRDGRSSPAKSAEGAFHKRRNFH